MVLGIDIGSSATEAALLDEALGLLGSWERPNRSHPAEAFRAVVGEIFAEPGRRIRALGITGAGREIVDAPPEVFQRSISSRPRPFITLEAKFSVNLMVSIALENKLHRIFMHRFLGKIKNRHT